MRIQSDLRVRNTWADYQMGRSVSLRARLTAKGHCGRALRAMTDPLPGVDQMAELKGCAQASDKGGHFGANQQVRDVKHPQLDRAIDHVLQALVNRHQRELHR
mgnify:FL=1